MVYYVLFESIATLIHIVHTCRGIGGIYFAAALVHGHEHGFDTARSACHQAGSTGGCYCETCDVASAYGLHPLVHFGIGLGKALDVGIGGFAGSVVYFKCAAFGGQLHRFAVGSESYRTVYAHREFCGFGCAVAQAHGSDHVAFGCGAETCAASAQSLGLDFEPEVAFGAFHFLGLGVEVDFLENGVDFLHLEVDDVVEQSLRLGCDFGEFFEIELGLGCEGIFNEGVEVDCQQTAAVVGAQRYFAAGIGGYGFESEVGIAIGHRFTADGIPE